MTPTIITTEHQEIIVSYAKSERVAWRRTGTVCDLTDAYTRQGLVAIPATARLIAEVERVGGYDAIWTVRDDGTADLNN